MHAGLAWCFRHNICSACMVFRYCRISTCFSVLFLILENQLNNLCWMNRIAFRSHCVFLWRGFTKVLSYSSNFRRTNHRNILITLQNDSSLAAAGILFLRFKCRKEMNGLVSNNAKQYSYTLQPSILQRLTSWLYSY